MHVVFEEEINNLVTCTNAINDAIFGGNNVEIILG
jgi:hypothetical protein